MNEKNMQTYFKKLVESDPDFKKYFNTTVFELKICKKRSMPFDHVKPHQEEALYKAKHNDLYHKISDSPIFQGMKTRFTKKKPFDCILFTQCDSYVVIWYYKPRQKKKFIFIDIDEWLIYKSKATKKSIREEEAEKIGVSYIL